MLWIAYREPVARPAGAVRQLERGDSASGAEDFGAGSELRAGLGRWISYYNGRRPHSGLAVVSLMSADAGLVLREADRHAARQPSAGGRHRCRGRLCAEAAGAFIDVPDETEDFDLASAAEQPDDAAQVRNLPQAVDPTFTTNLEGDLQARNASAYEVELMVTPSRAGTLASRDRGRPVPLPEQN